MNISNTISWLLPQFYRLTAQMFNNGESCTSCNDSLEDYYKYLGKYKKPVSTETPTFGYH